MRRYISRQKSATVAAGLVRKASTQRAAHEGRQLAGGVVAPAGGHALQEERREFALQLVLEGEIEPARRAGLAVAQDGLRLARIVVAVVAEEDDLAAELRLQPPRGPDLGEEEPAGKEAARLLAETDDGAHDNAETGAAVPRAPMTAWRTG